MNVGVRLWNGEEQVVREEEEGGKDLYHQTSQSQPNLINSSSAVWWCQRWSEGTRTSGGRTDFRICLCLRRWWLGVRLRWT